MNDKLNDKRERLGEVIFDNQTGLLLNLVISPKGNCFEARLFIQENGMSIVTKQYIRVGFDRWQEFKNLVDKADELITKGKEHGAAATAKTV